MLDTKGLCIHSVRLAHLVGGETAYETFDSPTQRLNCAAFVERDADRQGLLIKDNRGVLYWTPIVNVVEIKWGEKKAVEGEAPAAVEKKAEKK